MLNSSVLLNGIRPAAVVQKATSHDLVLRGCQRLVFFSVIFNLAHCFEKMLHSCHGEITSYQRATVSEENICYKHGQLEMVTCGFVSWIEAAAAQ